LTGDKRETTIAVVIAVAIIIGVFLGNALLELYRVK
jgi:hypothetical protein